MAPASVLIAGGGPAGMMAGFLLARQGVRVMVIEKHADFLRDFRGDTVHPSTLRVFDELGLLDRLLALPHTKLAEIEMAINGETFRAVDFSGLSARTGFIAMMPQWDLLDFIADAARACPSFTLRQPVEAVGVIRRGGRVSGLRVQPQDGAEEELAADLVVLADGRNSRVRADAGLVPETAGAPIDVLWFRLPRLAGDRSTLGNIGDGALVVQIDRGDYWQCACVIAKGQGAAMAAAGIEGLAGRVGRAAPLLADRVRALPDWDAVKLLSVQIDWLERWWQPGLMVIGDAAHAMSPVGGVGINYAVQDAVALANILGPGLARGDDVTPLLAAVQKRRKWPVRLVQRMQVAVQDRVLTAVLAGGQLTPPRAIQLLNRWRWLRRLAGRAIGWGPRPEHVRPQG